MGRLKNTVAEALITMSNIISKPAPCWCVLSGDFTVVLLGRVPDYQVHEQA